MAIDTSAAGPPDAGTPDAAIAGLDHLDLVPTESRRIAERVWAALWPKLLAIALVLVVWQLIHLSGYKKDLLPGPATVFSGLWAQMHHALLWQAVGTTLRRAVIGFALAIVIGTVVGALVSRIKPLRAAVGSLITALQTMPSIAWFPFAIILFGATTQAILFVIVLGAAPSIANGLITGVDYTPPLLLRAGKSMGLRRLSLYRHLILPASLPVFVAGLKQGWAFAWRSLLAGELLVIILGQPSIGVLLNNDQDQADMTGAISIMIVILVLGIAVDALFNVANNRIRRRWGVVDNASNA
jgi:NitT/TauT family transport system permease protein